MKIGLKPVLRKLGIPTADAGLHAFRHGLSTELVEASVPLTVLQSQLRHADIKTTLKVYAHVIPQSSAGRHGKSRRPIITFNQYVTFQTG